MKLDLCCPWDGYGIFLNRENCVQHCENNALLGPFCPTHPTLASVQGFTPQPVVSNLMSKLPVKYFPVVVAGRVITLTWLHFKSRPLMFLMQERQWERCKFKKCDLQIPLCGLWRTNVLVQENLRVNPPSALVGLAEACVRARRIDPSA